MRSIKYLILLATTSGIILTGCSQKEEKRIDPASELYNRCLKTTRLYVDSMKNAKDSAEVFRLEKELDAAINRINYEFPADTHLSISEGENDTLTNVTMRYVEIRDSLLYRFAHPITEADSVENSAETGEATSANVKTRS